MSNAIASPFLSISGLVAGYGRRDILHGVDIEVGEGEIVAVIGHNGAGKSTLLKAIFGAIPSRAGTIVVSGETLRVATPRKMIARRFSYLPQGNRIFGDLTVYENLRMGAYGLSDTQSRAVQISLVTSLFPQLEKTYNQKANTLSGGQKQLLALATAFAANPRMLLLDEPSLGLAPSSTRSSLSNLKRLCKEQTISALVVEQKVREVLDIADRVYALRGGHITYSGPVEPLQNLDTLRSVYF